MKRKFIAFIWIYIVFVATVNAQVNSSRGTSRPETTTSLRKKALDMMYENPTVALKYSKKALFLAEKNKKNKELAICYELIARLCANQLNYLQATEYYIRALRYYEKGKDDSAIATLCNDLGRVYTDLKQYHIGSRYFFKSLEIGKNLQNKKLIANSYRNLAYHFVMQEYYESALQYNDKALKIYEEMNNDEGVADICNTFGQIYIDTDRPTQALPFLNKALESYIHAQNEWKEITTLGLIGKAYLMQKDYETAERYFDQTHKKSFRINHQQQLLNNIRNFARLYRAMGLHQRANRYYENYNDMYETVYNNYSLQQTSFLQALYEMGQKESEIKVLNQEKEEQTHITYILVIGLVVFSIFAVILWRSFQLRNKAYSLLEKRKKEIEEQKEVLQIQGQELRQAADELTSVNYQLKDAQHKIETTLYKEQSSKKQLQETYEQLKNTQTQLVQSEKMASLGQLTAGIAHEINNPINFVFAGADALTGVIDDLFDELNTILEGAAFDQKPDLDELTECKEDIYALLESMRTGAKRTSDIVKSLRTFSRLDEDALKRTDLHENIDSTLLILGNQSKDHVEVVKDYSPDISEIECFPGPLNQVFMNILANAIQAIEGDEGKIYIKTYKSSEEEVIIKIKDTGKGMDEKTRSKIFEPFFTTKDVGKGTGLGLSISHSIIQKHKGTIDVVSQVGKGSEFTISIPQRVEEPH